MPSGRTIGSRPPTPPTTPPATPIEDNDPLPLTYEQTKQAVTEALTPFFQKSPLPSPAPTIPSPVPTASASNWPIYNGFVVGVEQQPPSSFQKWVGRGVNTMVTVPNISGAVDGKAWVSACRQHGLHYVIQADAIWNGGWDEINNDPLFLAFTISDEPNDHKITVADFQAQATQLRAKTNRPLFCNIDGWKCDFPDTGYEPQGYISVSDIGSWDRYSVNRGEGHDAIVPTIQAYPPRLKGWGAKKVWMYAECSNQNLATQGWTGPNARGPIPSEQDAIVDTAIANGVSGIIWFPQQIGGGDYGFVWDAMMVDNVTAMTAKNFALCQRTG